MLRIFSFCISLGVRCKSLYLFQIDFHGILFYKINKKGGKGKIKEIQEKILMKEFLLLYLTYYRDKVKRLIKKYYYNLQIIYILFL